MKEVIFASGIETYSCAGSFDKLGILNPVIVQRDGDGFHLVDGRKRIKYSKQNGMTLVDAIVLHENTPITDIIILILCDKRKDIGSSIMNRVQFICFAVSLNVPEEWILKTLAHCTKHDKNKYLFQSKNPKRIYALRKYIPKESIIGTTIESNREYPKIYGNSPNVEEKNI